MRIALIAMSGTRAVNKELHQLGQHMAGFHERWETIASLPSLSLLTLAGLTPGEHRYIYMEVEEVDTAGLWNEQVDLVAISSYSAQIYEAYRLARRCRDRGIPTVIGGPHVSVLPQEAAAHCDAVVVGQGELVWRQVLDDCAAGKLQSVYGALDRDFDLENAPMPAFDLLDVSQYNRLSVQTSRGCPHHCEFCASSVLVTGGYNQKPIGKVLAEIDAIKTVWKRPFIEFADDNSFVRRAYWRELLPELKKRRIRWFAEADLAVGQDEELLKLMRDSGCAQVLIGLESPLEADLDGLDLKTNWKKEQFHHYRERIRTIQSHGITVNGCFVVGMDTHTPDIFDAIYDFVRDTELFEVQVTILTPFPGTPLYDRLRREGRLLDETAWYKCTLYDVNYQPSHMSVEELNDGFRDLCLRLYCDEFTKWRRDTFKKHWRAQLRRNR